MMWNVVAWVAHGRRGVPVEPVTPPSEPMILPKPTRHISESLLALPSQQRGETSDEFFARVGARL